MNPEDDDEQFLKLPISCLEIVLDCPFIFDLLKSETFDWEINDKIYSSSQNQSDPCLGILGGIIHLLIRGYESPFGSPRTNSEFHTYHPKFYHIGRFN